MFNDESLLINNSRNKSHEKDKIREYFLFYSFNFLSQQNNLTLQQCIETGIANNLDVLQSDLQVQTDEIRLEPGKAEHAARFKWLCRLCDQGRP